MFRSVNGSVITDTGLRRLIGFLPYCGLPVFRSCMSGFRLELAEGMCRLGCHRLAALPWQMYPCGGERRAGVL